jgi:hypothetical protein
LNTKRKPIKPPEEPEKVLDTYQAVETEKNPFGGFRDSDSEEFNQDYLAIETEYKPFEG